jgi:hypothetical protein
MGTSSDADLIEATTWFATDAVGHVAAFYNGEIPPSAMEFLRKWSDVEDRILELPVISEVHLLIRKEDYWSGAAERSGRRLCQQNRDAVANLMWPHVEQNVSALPKRGIYHLKGEDRADGWWPWTYKVIATPLAPIHLDALPEDVRPVVSATRFPLRFADVQRINVRET